MDIAINNVLIPDFRELKFFTGSIGITGDRIAEISHSEIRAAHVVDGMGRCVSPGLIDCHCHIESSCLTPLHFGNTVSLSGTLHVVADCHEIANVAGRKGLNFFMENSRASACNIMFAVPSCVPATPFATSGGRLDLEDILYFLEKENVVALGELMNVPAVIAQDRHFMEMIKAARRLGRRVNGHAPRLHGDDLAAYIHAGVDDDHESETYAELVEKTGAGLHVFIREGSAEHTDRDAYRILIERPEKVSFCTDDKSISDIFEKGHINFNVAKAVASGIGPETALRAASYTGLRYYGLDEYSEIRPGCKASLVMFNDMKDFIPDLVISEGKLVEKAYPLSTVPDFLLHSIKLGPVAEPDIPRISEAYSRIAIGVEDGSLVTDGLTLDAPVYEPDTEHDLLKLVVMERYGHGNSSACLIHGFGMNTGAMASSVAHDCHNIIAVGVDDQSIVRVINRLIENQGGLAVYDNKDAVYVPLEIGGIVSDAEPHILSEGLRMLKKSVCSLGCTLSDPFATLSFMALEVIPHIKLTDRGLFDVDRFEYM